MELWWPLRIPQRLLLLGELILLPLRFLTMLAELILAAFILGSAYIGWGIYTRSISDAEISQVIGIITQHALSILHQQNVY